MSRTESANAPSFCPEANGLRNCSFCAAFAFLPTRTHAPTGPDRIGIHGRIPSPPCRQVHGRLTAWFGRTAAAATLRLDSHRMTGSQYSELLTDMITPCDAQPRLISSIPIAYLHRAANRRCTDQRHERGTRYIDRQCAREQVATATAIAALYINTRARAQTR